MSLERELQTYLDNRPEWVAAGQAGRWAVIHGVEVLGLFDNLDAAMTAGYDQYGLDEPFMARQISETDHPIRTTRRAVHVPHKP